MSDIVINIDKPLYVSRLEMTLVEMIQQGNWGWPQGATCAMQESDGAILWFNCSLSDAHEARLNTDYDRGLVPILSMGQQIHCEYFELDEQPFSAADWETAVVIYDDINGN